MVEVMKHIMRTANGSSSGRSLIRTRKASVAAEMPLVLVAHLFERMAGAPPFCEHVANAPAVATTDRKTTIDENEFPFI